MRSATVLLLVTIAGLLAGCSRSTDPKPGSGPATEPPAVATDKVSAEIAEGILIMRNSVVERRWTLDPFVTQSFTDLRTGKVWTADSPDFALKVGSVEVGSDRFSVANGNLTISLMEDGSAAVQLTLAPTPLASVPAGLLVTRTLRIYPGVAGVRAETSVSSAVPVVISGYTLDSSIPAGGVTAEMHAFRAGGDWREPEWQGPPLSLGDAQTGDWRKSTSGSEVNGTAEWLSVADEHDQRLFYVMERNDQASSSMSFSGGTARAYVDLSRDVLYLGPLEESGHIGNPLPGPGRQRVIVPGTPLRLEPVFTGLATSRDDEPWQHYKYLANFRAAPYRRDVTFNSNGTDDNLISTGAKDDLDFQTFTAILPVAQQMGIETFIFDDGWQGRSGDWCPDSESDDPACQDPRRGTDTGYPARFPDSSFSAVQAQLQPAGMRLGLWMSPMHFHPTAIAFENNPQWACLPLSIGLLALNRAQPYDSSSEAGIVQWNPEALSPTGGKNIDYLESRIRRAIDEWGVRYFKFDFTAWLDCAGVYTVDMYGYRESFMAMLDRVLADHPDLTIQMDETNDYRLWPFEALVRGPTWYQNGSPTPNDAMHANHVLAPYVPLYALGRNALRVGDLANYSADYQMAVALLSHMTFFNDLRQLPAEAVPVIRKWTDYYKAHREDLAQFAYPLLEDDPYSGDNWVAIQTWNPELGRGALLVYRQDAAEATHTIRLRNVPDGNYRLLEAPAETATLEFSAEQLRAGIDIDIGSQRSARVFRIEKKF